MREYLNMLSFRHFISETELIAVPKKLLIIKGYYED
jgi:hypothetical protein